MLSRVNMSSTPYTRSSLSLSYAKSVDGEGLPGRFLLLTRSYYVLPISKRGRKVGFVGGTVAKE